MGRARARNLSLGRIFDRLSRIGQASGVPRDPARLLRIAASRPLGLRMKSSRSAICGFRLRGFLNAGVFDGGRFGGGCFGGLFGGFGSLFFVGFGAVKGIGFVIARTCCDHDWRKWNVFGSLTRSLVGLEALD